MAELFKVLPKWLIQLLAVAFLLAVVFLSAVVAYALYKGRSVDVGPLRLGSPAGPAYYAQFSATGPTPLRSGDWVQQLKHYGDSSCLGCFEVEFVRGTFSEPPVCTVSVNGASMGEAAIGESSKDRVVVYVFREAVQAGRDLGFNLICGGK